MSTIKHGGPAFPAVTVNDTEGPSLDPFGALLAPGSQSTYSGMTLRDYFAARAMQAMYQVSLQWVPDGEQTDQVTLSIYAELAIGAYAVADAMLRAREGGAA